MAGVIKVNPVADALNWEQVGKEITWFTVDYIVSMAAELGPLELIPEAYRTIQLGMTIIAAGPLIDGGTQQTFGVEGEFVAADLSRIQVALRAGGHDAGTTVTATKLGILTTAVVA